ncbi:Glycerol kinase [compost metagenome]
MLGGRVSELVVGGGLSGSSALLQIQADLTGMPVRRTKETDRASLRGIAFLAGSSGLLWDSLQQARTTLVTDAVFEPQVGADERHARRALWHARVASELAHTHNFNHASTGEISS